MKTKLTPAELEARLAKRLAELQTLPQLTREIEIEITPIPKRAAKTEGSPAPAETTFQDDAARAAKPEDPDAEGTETTDEDEADGDRFEISISSETEVPRWFGAEILDHSKESIDLSRAANGLAFCMDHDTTRQVGIVENIGVGKDKKLRGVLRFSRSADAQDVKRDVQDKIRKFISVGYRIAEIVLESSSDEQGDVYRVTRWMPMEVSSVAVPADTSVGTDRSAGAETFPVQVRSAVQITASKPQITTEVRANMDPKVAAEIMRLGSAHGIDQERVAKWIEENRTVDSVSSEILAEIANKRGSTKPLTQPAAEQVTLTEREQKEYRVTRGILTLANNQEQNRSENCFELEVSQEIEKKTDASVKRHGGLFVPWNIGIDASLARAAYERLERLGLVSRAGIATALTTSTTNQGKEIVFTEPGAFIDFLYNRMLLKAFGAQTISGLQGNLSFPKQTGKANGSWVSENPGTDVADSNLTLGSVPMSPKTYQSSTAYSRQLLAQGVVDVDMLCRADLAKDAALAFDRAGFVGDGTNGSPTGVMNYAGVQSYTLKNDSGNGAQPVWDDIVLMESMVEDVNADELGAFAWATTPGIKARLKLTAKLGNTLAIPIWEPGNTVDGYKAGATNQLPKNQTKGTGTNLAPLIYGCFAQLICGVWGSGFELVVDPYRLKKQGMIELTTFVMGDIGIRQAPAFVVAKYCSK